MTFYEMKHGMSCGESYDYLGQCSESDAEYVDIEAFNELKKMMPRWIPVSERLPISGVFELVYSDKDGYDIAQFYDGDFCNQSDAIIHATHWMPIPKGPIG
jgi:hypothetical protein